MQEGIKPNEENENTEKAEAEKQEQDGFEGLQEFLDSLPPLEDPPTSTPANQEIHTSTVDNAAE